MDRRMRLAQRHKMEDAHEILVTLLLEDSVSRQPEEIPLEPLLSPQEAVDEDPS
jgi:hypothetical protein